MTVLHTLSCPPGHAHSEACLARLAAGDSLLLLGEGVYHALAGSRAADELAGQVPCPVYALQADAQAAGVLTRLTPGVAVVDEDGFVELTERHPRQLAWY